MEEGHLEVYERLGAHGLDVINVPATFPALIFEETNKQPHEQTNKHTTSFWKQPASGGKREKRKGNQQRGKKTFLQAFLHSSSSQFQNNYFTEMCRGSEAGSYLRLIDFCITQL